VRSFSLAVSGDMAGKHGWYIDLVSPSLGNTGERIVGENKFFGNVLLASSMIPSTDACTPGGTGYLNAIDPFTGANVSNLFFDANNDLQFNDSDRIGTARAAIGSISPGINLPSDPILIGNRLVSSGTSGDIRSLSVNNPVRNGRISWREVVNK
jgi:type IV pilus assembly protein PilY1